MPAQDPQGGMKFWTFEGKLFRGVLRTGTTIDVSRYWLDGRLLGFVYPEVVVGPQITSISDTTWPDDIASVSGLESLFVKKVAGVNAQ